MQKACGNRALDLADLLYAVRGGEPEWPCDVGHRVATHEAGHAISLLHLGIAERKALMTLIDEHTRECLAIRVARRINKFGVLETMADVMLMRDVPEHIRSDNGAEMTAKVVRNWLTRVGAKTLFIEPGSPWKNDYCKSFNEKLRDELMHGELFYSLKEAQIAIEQWRKHYNTIKPHSALNYRPPAPQTFAPLAHHLDEIMPIQ